MVANFEAIDLWRRSQLVIIFSQVNSRVLVSSLVAVKQLVFVTVHRGVFYPSLLSHLANLRENYYY